MPPLLLVHGDADPMVPFAAMGQARAACEALGFNVATHASPGLGHSIDEPGLRLGGEFLAGALVAA
jgi:phospholipase/carboxylesterase